jgi:hypothetical protein
LFEDLIIHHPSTDRQNNDTKQNKTKQNETKIKKKVIELIMGKKSRNNKKTGNDATIVARASGGSGGSGGSAAAAAGNERCFHGSTIDKFIPNSEYMKALKEYLVMRGKLCQFDKVTHNANTDQPPLIQLIAIHETKYADDNMHLMEDPEFCRFLFSYCTVQYLQSDNLKDKRLRYIIVNLLLLCLSCRYDHIPKAEAKTDGNQLDTCLQDTWDKNMRDITSDRGIIKCLARGIDCDCMKEEKRIANSMDKIGICYGCEKYFPKETLSFFNGCQIAKYHNRDCQINDWATHKITCKMVKELNKNAI